MYIRNTFYTYNQILGVVARTHHQPTTTSMAKIGINDFIDTLLLGSDMFRTLKGVEPILDSYGRPTFVAGRRGPIFRVRIGSEHFALKCYSHSASAFEPLHNLLAELHSPLIVAPRLLTQELWVGHSYADVSLYAWVEGPTLDWELRRALRTGEAGHITHLAESFARLCVELLACEWRHGDLKPENIIIEPSGQMRLIDCDGLYHPSLSWQGQAGTPPYVHPKRQDAFDEHIDDYSIALIITSLYALATEPSLFDKELMVTLPSLGTKAHIATLFEGNSHLMALLAALHSNDYKINHLNHTIQCILHK